MVGRVGRPRWPTSPSASGHSPETVEEAAEARRVGGAHRRKKRTVASIYGFHGLRTIEDLQTLLETASVESLALENSIGRNRALAGMVATGTKLIEVGEIEERLAALEATLAHRPASDDGFGGTL